MEVCKVVPFLTDKVYCYGPVWLSFWDRAFYVALIVALIAIAINYIQENY